MNYRILPILLSVAFIAVALLAGIIWTGKRQVEQTNRQLQTDLATVQAENVALTSSLIEAKETAVSATIQLNTQTQIALANQVATQALTKLDDQYDIALLLSAEASRIADTPTTQSALFYALRYNPAVIAIIPDSRWAEDLEFSPNGRILAANYGGGQIRLYDVPLSQLQGEPLIGLVEVEGEGTYPASINFSPDGQLIAATNPAFSAEGNHMVIWDMNSVEPIATSQVVAENLLFMPDGQHLVSSSSQEVIYWQISSGELLELNRFQYANDDDYPLQIAIHPSGEIIAVGDVGDTIILWNPLTGEQQNLLAEIEIVFDKSIAFSPDGSNLVFNSSNALVLWNVQTGEWTEYLSTSGWGVADFSAANQSLLLSHFSKESLRLWNVQNQTFASEPFNRWGNTETPLAAAFSSDGKTLASSTEQGNIVLWDGTAVSHLGREFIHPPNGATSLVFVDSETLMIGDGDGNQTAWDITTGAQVASTFSSQIPAFNEEQIVSSPNGNWAAKYTLGYINFGRRFRAISLLDSITHQEIGGSTPFMDYLLPAFSPDGNFLASLRIDNTIVIWDLRLENWQEAVCHITNRNFALEEWNLYFPDTPYRKTCPNFP